MRKFLLAGLLGGLAIFIVSMALSFVVQAIAPYDIFSLAGMRSIDDPLMMFFFLVGWVYAFPMAYAYSHFKGSMQGTFVQKGIRFGFLVWLLTAVPTTFIIFTTMTYPLGFHLDSIVGGLIWLMAGSIVIAKFMD